MYDYSLFIKDMVKDHVFNLWGDGEDAWMWYDVGVNYESK